MYCWFCGKQNTDTSKFCYNCGKQLVQDQSEKIVDDEPVAVEIPVAEESATVTDVADAALKEPQLLDQPLNSARKLTPQKAKYVPTLTDKEATASLVLSLMGILIFWGLPIHILALVLGIRGRKSEKRKTLSLVGIGVSIFCIAVFAVLIVLIIANYPMIINSDFFAIVYRSIF